MNDNASCRDTFRGVESLYASSNDRFLENAETFSNLHQNILDQMESNDVTLVDNDQFIFWATRTPNPDIASETMETVPDTPFSIQRYFDSEYGA